MMKEYGCIVEKEIKSKDESEMFVEEVTGILDNFFNAMDNKCHAKVEIFIDNKKEKK